MPVMQCTVLCKISTSFANAQILASCGVTIQQLNLSYCQIEYCFMHKDSGYTRMGSWGPDLPLSFSWAWPPINLSPAVQLVYIKVALKYVSWCSITSNRRLQSIHYSSQSTASINDLFNNHLNNLQSYLITVIKSRVSQGPHSRNFLGKS